MRIVGLDFANPGSDMTVMAELRNSLMQAFRVDLPPEQPLRSATEVEMRLADYWRRKAYLYESMAKALPIRALEVRVQCIKYGRRKRKWRRLIGPPIGLLTGKKYWH